MEQNFRKLLWCYCWDNMARSSAIIMLIIRELIMGLIICHPPLQGPGLSSVIWPWTTEYDIIWSRLPEFNPCLFHMSPRIRSMNSTLKTQLESRWLQKGSPPLLSKSTLPYSVTRVNLLWRESHPPLTLPWLAPWLWLIVFKQKPQYSMLLFSVIKH